MHHKRKITLIKLRQYTRVDGLMIEYAFYYWVFKKIENLYLWHKVRFIHILNVLYNEILMEDEL